MMDNFVVQQGVELGLQHLVKRCFFIYDFHYYVT